MTLLTMRRIFSPPVIVRSADGDKPTPTGDNNTIEAAACTMADKDVSAAVPAHDDAYM